MTAQTIMLDKMYKCILANEQKTVQESFLLLLDYIATKFEFKDSFTTPWMKMKTSVELTELFDVEVLRQDKWDWFGELHATYNVGAIQGDYIISREEVQKIADALDLQPKDLPAPFRILDICAATGRNILMLSEKYPDAIFYGAEQDPIAYKVLLLNMKIYGIASSVVNTNNVDHDLREHSPNWRHSNVWEPVKKSKYLSEEELDARREIKQATNTYTFV